MWGLDAPEVIDILLNHCRSFDEDGSVFDEGFTLLVCILFFFNPLFLLREVVMTLCSAH
jgi:hypothetical protein